jgi:predicted Na+-dependent transporter
MRNISAGAVLAAEYFPPEVLFPVAFSPLFLQLTTSVVAKLLLKLPDAKGQHSSP